MPMYVASGIGVLLILLGFIALLKQRTYIDTRTKEPVEIEIPILGKMKTNYPALVFVFLGCVMTVIGVGKFRYQETQWLIDVTMTTDVQGLNWQQGRMSVFPTKADIDVDHKTGRFTIKLAIEDGKTFEDVIQRIDYSHERGSVQIVPKDEFGKKVQTKSSKLISYTENSRSYVAPLVSLPPPLK